MHCQESVSITYEGFQKQSVLTTPQRAFSNHLERSWSRCTGFGNPALEMCFIRTKQNLIRAGWKSCSLQGSPSAKQPFHRTLDDLERWELGGCCHPKCALKESKFLWGLCKDCVISAFGCQWNMFLQQMEPFQAWWVMDGYLT